MEKAIVTAAKWLGGCLVLSTIILIIGLYLLCGRLAPTQSNSVADAIRDLRNASPRVKVDIPEIRLSPVDLNFRPVAGASSLGITVAPIKVETVEKAGK